MLVLCRHKATADNASAGCNTYPAPVQLEQPLPLLSGALRLQPLDLSHVLQRIRWLCYWGIRQWLGGNASTCNIGTETLTKLPAAAQDWHRAHLYLNLSENDRSTTLNHVKSTTDNRQTFKKGKIFFDIIKRSKPWALSAWFVWFGSCFVIYLLYIYCFILWTCLVTIEPTETSAFLPQAMVRCLGWHKEGQDPGQVRIRDPERLVRRRWRLAASDGLLQFIKLWSVQCCALHSAGKLFLIVLARPDNPARAQDPGTLHTRT